MVDIKCTVNKKDISKVLIKNLISLEVVDYDGTKADELSITLSNVIKRPLNDDKIKLWIDYNFYGTFLVDSTETNYLNLLTITATSANFSKTLKTKQNRNYKETSLHKIINKIAEEHKLKTKIDFEDINYENIIQEKESDLHFLNRLAEKYDAIFSIKNDTLLFLKRSENLPTFLIDLNDCFPWSIKHKSREKYQSCIATWRDTKYNKNKSVKIGDEEPILKIDGNYLSESEAMVIAKASLAKSKRGTIEGNLSKKGEYLSAGSHIQIINSKQDDGVYSLSIVTTTIDKDGFRVKVLLTN